MDNPACQLIPIVIVGFLQVFISFATPCYLNMLVWYSKWLNTPVQSSICNNWSLEVLLSRPLWSVGSSLLCRSWFLSLKKVMLIKEKQQQQHPLTDTALRYCLFGPWSVFCQILVSDIGSLSGRLVLVWQTPGFQLSGNQSIWNLLYALMHNESDKHYPVKCVG